MVERNVIRFRPQSVVVRQSSGVGAGELVRVLVAATAARAHVLLSTARPLPAELLPLFSRARSPLDVVDQVVEDDATFLGRAAAGTLLQDGWSDGTEPELDPIDMVLAQGAEPRRNVAFGGPGSRVRLLGGDARALEEALGAGTDTTIHDDPWWSPASSRCCTSCGSRRCPSPRTGTATSPELQSTAALSDRTGRGRSVRSMNARANDDEVQTAPVMDGATEATNDEKLHGWSSRSSTTTATRVPARWPTTCATAWTRRVSRRSTRSTRSSSPSRSASARASASRADEADLERGEHHRDHELASGEPASLPVEGDERHHRDTVRGRPLHRGRVPPVRPHG